MRSGARRRLDAAVLAAGALVVGAITAVGGALGDAERVTRMWVGATLLDGGGAELVEVIDYDFGVTPDRHGIVRTIPGLSTDSMLEVRSTSAPDGIASKAPTSVDGEAGIEIKVGDPATTITGRHRYEIRYDLPRLAAGGHLAWDAVGAQWTVPVSLTEVHLVAPWQLDHLVCSAGASGATGGCTLRQPEPGHLVAVVGSLDPGEGVTIAADRGAPLGSTPPLPTPPADAPPDPGAGLARPAGVASLAALLAAAGGSRAVRRAGRERVGAGGAADAAWAGSRRAPDPGQPVGAAGSAAPPPPSGEVLLDEEGLAALATTELSPPSGITPSMGGVILAEAVRPEHKVAWLIEAAIEGGVELVEDDGRVVRLQRRAGGSPGTNALLDVAFAGRDELTLGTYDPSFARAWTQVGTMLESWQRSSGLWDPAGDRRRRLVRSLGALGAVAGAGAAALGGALASRWGTQWLALVAVAAVVAGAGSACAVRGWELRVRTPQGSGLWLRVESFRRFLAGSEAFHAEEAAARGVLREYTAWAVAVGEVDRWSRAVAAATAIPASAAGLGYAHLAPTLVSSTSSTSTAPSSSGSSGGGGGSVGGGGGGGGGSSW